MARGVSSAKETALGIVNSGQHGLDFLNGEIRLSVLRSAAYCHERGFPPTDPPARKYMDQGVHDFRMLVTVGDPETVRAMLPGLSDWLAAPPPVFAHLPVGSPAGRQRSGATPEPVCEWFSLHPSAIRLLAFKRSHDKKALIIRIQESAGTAASATLKITSPVLTIRLRFRPLEIKTLRIARRGTWREVDPLAEE